VNSAGRQTRATGQFTTVTPVTYTLPYLFPSPSIKQVGVAQPITVHFDEPIADRAAAERALRRGYDGLEEMGAAAEVAPVLAALLAQALYAQGRDEEALEFTDLSEAAAASDDLFAQVQWRAARAKVLARLGQTDPAESLAAKAVALAEQSDFLVLHGDALVDLAEVLRLAGRPSDGAPPVEQALRLYEQKGSVVSVPRARALLAELVAPAH
jgi:tetratricopeptide (TPR) repeat protein